MKKKKKSYTADKRQPLNNMRILQTKRASGVYIKFSPGIYDEFDLYSRFMPKTPKINPKRTRMTSSNHSH